MLCTLKKCKGDVTVPLVPKGRTYSNSLRPGDKRNPPLRKEVCQIVETENKPEPLQLKTKTKNKQKRLFQSLCSELETSNQQVACKVLLDTLEVLP